MLRVSDLVKRFDTSDEGIVGGIRNVSFEVAAGEFLHPAWPPRDAEKTTTLRCVAGLEEPSSGIISIGDREVFSSRGTGCGAGVRAQYRHGVSVLRGLAPHVGKRQCRVPVTNVPEPAAILRRKSQRKWRGLWKPSTSRLLGERYASQLSGGQQQRLALARAIVGEPAAAAAGRTAEQPRCPASRSDAVRAATFAEGDWYHRDLRYPRPIRGAGAFRPNSGHARWLGRSDWGPLLRYTTNRPAASSPISSVGLI